MPKSCTWPPESDELETYSETGNPGSQHEASLSNLECFGGKVVSRSMPITTPSQYHKVRIKVMKKDSTRWIQCLTLFLLLLLATVQ
mmetsp:Transcript_28365/g.51383  ORF Transcript_28365/g.51383 Transcript_28365/m.51383 type:complete len:86 (+) Transcript_28365:765-1022(+)